MNKQAKYDVIVGLSFFFIYIVLFILLTFLMIFIDSIMVNDFWRVLLLIIMSAINLGNIIIGSFMPVISLKTLFTKREVSISIAGDDDYGVSSETNSNSN